MAKRSAKVSVAGLALPIRVWAQRFAFLGFVALSFALMLLSKAESSGIERMRLAIVDAVSPILFVLSQPVQAVGQAVDGVENFFIVYEENRLLRDENARLVQWVQEARRLGVENATLRAQLEYVPDKRSQFVTARVVADTGGTFFHSLLINAGARQFIRRGQAVIWQGGLIGRIAEVGGRSSRVLLMTDINSRIPVVIESTGDRAIVRGDNSTRLVLQFLPGNSPISPGDRIVYIRAWRRLSTRPVGRRRRANHRYRSHRAALRRLVETEPGGDPRLRRRRHSAGARASADSAVAIELF